MDFLAAAAVNEGNVKPASSDGQDKISWDKSRIFWSKKYRRKKPNEADALVMNGLGKRRMIP